MIVAVASGRGIEGGGLQSWARGVGACEALGFGRRKSLLLRGGGGIRRSWGGSA